MAKVVLPDGKNVEISTVLLNKEQNINVGKTYVTTVKKAVTKVSEDFYKVSNEKKEDASSPIFEAIKDNVFETPVVAGQPSLEQPGVVEPVAPVLPEVQPVLTPLPVENNPTIPMEPISDSMENAQIINTVSPELPVVNDENITVPNDVQPEVKPTVEPIIPVNQGTVEAPKVEPILPVEPIQNVSPAVSAQAIGTSENSDPKLFFDGSKETNLNMALGEVSEDKTMTTESEGVQALRQFGSDEPVLPPQEQLVTVQENAKTLTRSKGFANNKFFVIIAIAFFIAACVFLGYEAFQYFQITG